MNCMRNDFQTWMTDGIVLFLPWPHAYVDRRRSKDSDATRTSNRGADVTKEPAPVVREKMYLESCHIFLCPSFPADQVSTFKKMIRMAGGLHVVEYDPMEVTHVLVPSNDLAPR